MFCIVFVYDWIKNGSSIWEAGGGDSLRQGGGGKERGEILHDRASEWVQKLEWEKESDRERKRKKIKEYQISIKIKLSLSFKIKELQLVR